MSTPSDSMATRLEILAAIMRHPSQLDPELFQRNLHEFNEIRLQFPNLMTHDELNQAMKSARDTMDDMIAHPYAGHCGPDDALGDWIERLEAEHDKRFG